MNVVDANVVVSGLRSRNGSSHLVLKGMLTGTVPFTASPAVILEYEDVLKRPGMFGSDPWINPGEVDLVLDAICAMTNPALPWFRFRPVLFDPKDDLYLECALAGGADTIITNDKGFKAPMLRPLGLRSISPGDFVKRKGS